MRLIRLLHRLEDWLLALLLTAMITLACTQIILRNFFEFSLLWADPLLRALVLWLGLLGAMVASRNNRHIAVDLVNRLAKHKWQRRVALLNAAFTSIVCGLIAVHGGRLVHLEYVDRTLAFAGVPAWALEAIIPIAFAVIALRYLVYGFVQWRTDEPATGETPSAP